MAAAAKFKVRTGQREFERGVQEHRLAALVARRQYGKTTIAARIALKKMMKTAGHTVIFGSVKLDLGREIILKESVELRRAFTVMAEQAAASKNLLDVCADGKSVAALNPDDFADLYEHSRLEMRLYHSKSVYSRTKVVALTPDAVGETGDLILDEVGRAKKFREVMEAMRPIIAANPEYRAILTTTPPPDDTHYSFELLSPPVGVEMPVNPKGNWYRSDLGIWVLRITAEDAYADSIPLYDDDTGEPLSPAESRAKDHDKDAWDRNYGCKFVIGGTSACGIVQLDTAQKRGIGHCEFFYVYGGTELEAALRWLLEHVGDGNIGFGWDLATTTKAVSNPSSFTVAEQQGNEIICRAIFAWKSDDPDVQIERARAIIKAVRLRRAGPGRGLCVDGTTERFFAKMVRKELGVECPVDIYIGSETVDDPFRPKEKITLKQLTCGVLVQRLDDNQLWLPANRYVREDWRLVKKEKGQFVCEPDVEGKHGDTFDSTRFGLRAVAGSGPVAYSKVNVPTSMGNMGMGKVGNEVFL